MKKTCLLGVSLFMLLGCSTASVNNEKGQEESASAMVMQEEITVDYAYNRSDFQTLIENNEVIALIRIDEIEGASNQNQLTQEYVSVYTYGKATIQEVYKGELTSNDNITFVRLGGEILFNEWVKGISSRDYERLIEKHDDTNSKMVNSNSVGNVAIEAGKTYLVSMIHDDSIHKVDEYSITAMEYGLREAKQAEGKSTKIVVKNNISGEWEALSDLLNGN